MLIPFGYYLLALFMLGPIAILIKNRLGKWAGWIYALAPFYGILEFLWIMPTLEKDHVLTESYGWIPQYEISLSFYFDGLSEFFGLLVLGIGALILIYGSYYTKAYPRKEVFMGHLILFMAAMLGLVIAGNLLTFFLFWELTGIFSYLLIGFDHEKESARKGALQALLITGLGGQALLAGFIVLGMAYPDYEFRTLLSNPAALQNSAFYFPALILILIGALTKSAQFPFHFWLPGAMVAPTPVSAYLHSATMVKAGIFLLLRLNPVLGGTESWHYILTVVGVTTMFVGAWSSVTQTDLKKVLAYSTISALGTIVLLIGTDTEYAINAAILYILVHAFYKGTLFMLAGVIQKQTHTREIPKLGGLYRYMPLTAVVMCLALVSMAGIPPMLGFISKELVYEAKVHAPNAYWFILPAGVITNMIMVFLSLRLSIDVFWGKAGQYLKRPEKPVISMILGPVVLVFLSLVLGIFPESIANALTAEAISDINPHFGAIELKLWTGWNTIQLISLLTLVLGGFLYIKKEVFIESVQRVNVRYCSQKFSDLFFRLIDRFLAFTKEKTGIVQHGYHRFYLMTIFSVASAFVWLLLWHSHAVEIALNFDEIPISQAAILLLIIVSVFYAVSSPSRVVALISMGVVGFGIVMVFIVFSGVDLPITMILAEVMMIILSMALLYYLPRYVSQSDKGERMRDAVIATAVGASMAVLILQANAVDLGAPISNFYKEVSYPEAFGRNIVNVILVDFRAFDTLGEITVLTIAALGIFSLMNGETAIEKMREESAILQIAAKILRPLLIALSVVVFLRGHNDPGGGFIAGLMVGAAEILYMMAFGVSQGRKVIFLNPIKMMGLGLAFSVLSGFPGVLFGVPFMKGEWIDLGMGIKLGTPILFDLGVYCTVIGMLTQTAFLLMEE